MKKDTIILAVSMLLTSFVCSLFAQQTPIFADYNYNTVVINPAYAGNYTNSDITLTNRGYLNQFEGSPKNIGITFNTLLNSKNIGLAAGFTNDKIGVTSTTNLFASYSYKLFFNDNRGNESWSSSPNTLSFGITGGITFYDDNLLELGIQNDPNFNNNINTHIPTIGIGFLYKKKQFYIGISAPNLLGDSLSSEENINLEVPFYAYGGYYFFTSRFEEIRINPSMLIKYVSGGPTQIDINAAANYKNKIEIGTGYRTNSSLNFLVGFYFSKKWRLLYNYNQTLRTTPLNNTHGIILSYRFGKGF